MGEGADAAPAVVQLVDSFPHAAYPTSPDRSSPPTVRAYVCSIDTSCEKRATVVKCRPARPQAAGRCLRLQHGVFARSV